MRLGRIKSCRLSLYLLLATGMEIVWLIPLGELACWRRRTGSWSMNLLINDNINDPIALKYHHFISLFTISLFIINIYSYQYFIDFIKEIKILCYMFYININYYNKKWEVTRSKEPKS